MYEIILSDTAKAGLQRLKANEPACYRKAVKMLDELIEHPKFGTGHPEPLKGKPEGRWSRHISQRHRLVYRILETEVLVEVIAVWGHYSDK